MNNNKKADMNFWLVMLVIALIFMVVVFFVMNNVFNFFGESTSKLQSDIKKQQEKEKDLFEGLGITGDVEKEETKSDGDK